MLLDLLRKLPIDIGQREVRGTTMGKRIALDLVGLGQGKQAIDVGCREGTWTQWLRSRGYTVTAIDIEKVFADCQIVDIEKPLPFRENTFDLIWCSEVIEHVADPATTLQEFRRVLRQGGEMIMTTPNSHSWIFLFGLLAKRLQRKDHKQFFGKKEIQKLFPRAKIFGYFPYFGKWRYKIEKGVGILSPTFIIHETEVATRKD